MARPRVHIHRLVAIILFPLVLIHDPQPNWCTQSDAKLGTRLYLYAILLVTGGCNGGLAWPPARHLRLNVVVGEGHARWAAVDDGTNGEAVRFAIADGSQSSADKDRYSVTYVVTLKWEPNVDIVVLAREELHSS
jgi:hypothetical protein